MHFIIPWILAVILVALGNGKIRKVAFPILPREEYRAAHKRLLRTYDLSVTKQ